MTWEFIDVSWIIERVMRDELETINRHEIQIYDTWKKTDEYYALLKYDIETIKQVIVYLYNKLTNNVLFDKEITSFDDLKNKLKN